RIPEREERDPERRSRGGEVPSDVRPLAELDTRFSAREARRLPHGRARSRQVVRAADRLCVVHRNAKRNGTARHQSASLLECGWPAGGRTLRGGLRRRNDASATRRTTGTSGTLGEPPPHTDGLKFTQASRATRGWRTWKEQKNTQKRCSIVTQTGMRRRLPAGIPAG